MKDSNYSLLFASLASLSNFPQLNYWMALLLTLGLITFFIHKVNTTKFIIHSALLSAALMLLAVVPIRTLVKNNQLYYGGSVGFYSDTLISLTKYIQYTPVVNHYTLIALNIFIAILLTGILFLIGQNIKNKPITLSVENSLLMLLFLSIASPIIQHYLLGTFYLIDRTALFYYPLFILVICFTYKFAPVPVQKTVLTIMIVSFSFNFLLNMNSYKTALWYFNSRTNTILTALNEKGKAQRKNVTLGSCWPFQVAIDYCKGEKNYPFVITEKSDLKKMHPDYYLFLNKELEKVMYIPSQQEILQFKKDTTLSFEEEGVYLFENIR